MDKQERNFTVLDDYEPGPVLTDEDADKFNKLMKECGINVCELKITKEQYEKLFGKKEEKHGKNH